MTTLPIDVLELAAELALDQREVAKRTAVNRAYYAAAHRACEIAIAAGLFDGPPNLHRTWGRLRALSNQPGWTSIGLEGLELKAMRLAAEYDLRRPLEGDAANAVDLARELIARMDALPPPAGVR